jgi:uncharacterized protein with NAD-binding domain and iron-sulfur cluster
VGTKARTGPPRVIVIGAGVAGLTAAHELAERGFSVDVYENRPVPGGKSRSIPVEKTGTDGRPDLPGEHGFRLFPGFYRHVPDTMKRIPYKTGTVADNLRVAQVITIARQDAPEVLLPAHLPMTPNDIGQVLWAAFKANTGLSIGDGLHFVNRLLALLTSSDRRRYEELEEQSWWEFSGAARRSVAYQKYLAKGLTRTLVAARAEEMSARTGGLILLQLLADMVRFGRNVDHVLCGPTTDVWIDPWIDHLRSLGVRFHFDTRVTKIHCAGGEIQRITVRHPATSEPPDVAKKNERFKTADYYVCALPVEILTKELIKKDPSLSEADPALGELVNLQTRWMNGVMFYLAEDVKMEFGHALYIDSEWALTSISQQQFWDDDFALSKYGDGRVRGCISLCVSDWDTKGQNGKGKTAKQCTAKEVTDEVWRQLKAHLNDDDLPEIVDGNRVTAFLDTAIEWPNPNEATNAEPLLINTAGSWKWRPDAVTRIGNFFLAGDYVRTNTDLATMEGANEAGRRAVNGILDAEGSPESRCAVWDLNEPFVLAPARVADRLWMEFRPHLLGARA